MIADNGATACARGQARANNRPHLRVDRNHARGSVTMFARQVLTRWVGWRQLLALLLLLAALPAMPAAARGDSGATKPQDPQTPQTPVTGCAVSLTDVAAD